MYHKRPLKWLFEREQYAQVLYHNTCEWCGELFWTTNPCRKYHYLCKLRSLFGG